ncbi:MAG: bifunctional rhamnulose-1-phosphate aldolase/short-chain dehydrogenase [Asticcacaulis sp.]
MTVSHTLHTFHSAADSLPSLSSPYMPADLWDPELAASMDEAQGLVYRSNLLGADHSLTNFGGGNTSAKISMPDPLSGEATEVLWVKGSGGDLGSMGLDGFATLYLDKVRGLENRYRGRAFEDEMVGLQAHCTFGLNGRAASIDTPLHAFIERKHADHLHPDSVIAIAASQDSEALCRAAYGDTVGWLGWQRPGFDLGLRLRDALAAHPHWRGVMLEGHGLISWADTGEACYRNSLELIGRANGFIASRSIGPAFGGEAMASANAKDQKAFFARVTPLLRSALSDQRLKITHINTDPAVLEFVSSRDMPRLAALGTSCPDHFLRTKIRPLVLEPDRLTGEGAAHYIDASITAYRQAYADYYARCRRADSPPMRDSGPVIVLIAGYGLIAFADSASGARIASEYYVNAIHVMLGAEAIGAYKALDEQEAFDIEYWQLEEAKLKRMPKPGPFAGRIAYITGAAGGIGSAVAEQVLMRQGCVVLVDIDGDRLTPVADRLSQHYGRDNVRMIISDVTQESDVLDAFDQAACEFGGIDIFVANAGIASAAPIEETSLELWRRNFSVLSEGYFLSVRSAFSAMKSKGGAIVFVVSKNGMVASANTAAYSAAKAAEIQLARVLALEGAPHGIRVNIVNPDAVLEGSHIWTGAWRTERAAAYNLAEDELEDFYRQRSLLKRSVLPEDVAAAVVFLVSDDSAKSTGNIFNVDAGHAPAFTR